MKRGPFKTYNLDSNRAFQSLVEKDVGIRKRKPSRLEERIRFRRQLSKNHKIVNNSSINSNDKEEEEEEDVENSTLSRTSSDSSDNSIPKNRDSKQRVDLLDLELPKPTIIEKSKTLFKERIDHILSNNHRPRMKPRAKSAPCTPLFQIKCPKRNYPDFWTKNEGKEAPDDQNQTPEVEEEEQKPIGNQLLISVMKESIGEIKDDLKSEEVTKLEEEEPEVAAVAVAASEASQSLEMEEKSNSDETKLGEPQELVPKNDDESEIILGYPMRGSEDSERAFHRPGDNCCIHRSNFNSNPKTEELFKDRRITMMKKLNEECRNGFRVSELNDLKISPGCNCSLKSCRRSILRSRSTPRRVTFCVPSLIPEEGNLSDAEVEATTELREPGGPKSSRCSCSRRCCDKLNKAVRYPRGNNCIVGKFGQNSARDSASKTSLTDDKEWNVDWDEDIRTQFADGVSFPRETRLAMNVLMQSRDNAITTRPISAVPKTQRCLHHPSREVKVLNKPDFGIFETAGEKAMHVATYAQALAVFQRTCDPLPDGRCKKKRHSVSKGGAYHNRGN